MPIRRIKIPAPVTIVDPISKQPALDLQGQTVTWSFETMLHRLMSNPMWSESFAAMRAQAAIMDAFDGARDGAMELAEEDWLKLKSAVENPRTQVDTVQGPQLVPGVGLHPAVSRQVIPLLSPIVDATTTH